jgi:DNA-directed RNA polymerase subunit RPC12/RpoP
MVYRFGCKKCKNEFIKVMSIKEYEKSMKDGSVKCPECN